MALTWTQKRINWLQMLLSLLQKELTELIGHHQHMCRHPYIIGWKSTSTGFVMTEGMVGCPRCGLTGRVTMGESSAKNYKLSPVFEDRPIHWILKEHWNKLFEHNAFAERSRLLKELYLDHPPR